MKYLFLKYSPLYFQLFFSEFKLKIFLFNSLFYNDTYHFNLNYSLFEIASYYFLEVLI